MTIHVADEDVTLSWMLVLEAACYEVYRRLAPLGCHEDLGDCIGTTSDLFWVDPGAMTEHETVVYPVLSVAPNGSRSVLTPRCGAEGYFIFYP